MPDTTVTYDLSGAVFADGTTLSGTWTAEYAPAGSIVGISDASLTASGAGGTTVFSGAYPLSYANPTVADDYEITFPVDAGGTYQGLYIDYTGQTPAAINGGEQTPYTSIALRGGEGPIALTATGTLTDTIACFARGTLIATPSGEMPVETLQPGTILTLARGGQAPVKWVGHRRVRPPTAAHSDTGQPIEVAQGALGGGLPYRTLRLSPEHALFLDDMLVPVGLLVNDRSIVRLDVEWIEYFHVELDAHDIILAEGAPVETYLDTGNRSIFANAPLVIPQPQAMPVDPCVPMMFDGERLRPLGARLAAIADLTPRDRAA